MISFSFAHLKHVVLNRWKLSWKLHVVGHVRGVQQQATEV